MKKIIVMILCCILIIGSCSIVVEGQEPSLNQYDVRGRPY